MRLQESDGNNVFFRQSRRGISGGGDGVSPKPGLSEDETYPSARGCDIQGKSLSVLLKKMDDKYGKLPAPR